MGLPQSVMESLKANPMLFARLIKHTRVGSKSRDCVLGLGREGSQFDAAYLAKSASDYETISSVFPA